MCITFRFYHLCGHTHSITTFPCTYRSSQDKAQPLPKDEAASSSLGNAYHPVTCPSDPTDSSEEIRLFPSLCAKCEKVGVISEWLDRTPAGRFDAIRAWNTMHRPELRKQSTLESEIAELENFDGVDSGTGSDVTAVNSHETVVADQISSTTLASSPLHNRASSRPSMTGTDISSLQERMAAVKIRLEKLIADCRP